MSLHPCLDQAEHIKVLPHTSRGQNPDEEIRDLYEYTLCLDARLSQVEI